MSNQPQSVILEKSLLANYLSNFDESHNLEEIKSIYTNTNTSYESYKNIGDYNNIPPISFPQNINNNSTPNYRNYNKYLLELTKTDNDDYYDEDPSINNYYINNTKINIKEKNKQIIMPNNKKWDALTQFYIGSLSIVGLYIIFKALQKSK